MRYTNEQHTAERRENIYFGVCVHNHPQFTFLYLYTYGDAQNDGHIKTLYIEIIIYVFVILVWKPSDRNALFRSLAHSLSATGVNIEFYNNNNNVIEQLCCLYYYCCYVYDYGASMCICM